MIDEEKKKQILEKITIDAPREEKIEFLLNEFFESKMGIDPIAHCTMIWGYGSAVETDYLRIRDIMLKEDLIYRIARLQIFRISPKGLQVYENGGYLKYLKDRTDDEKRDKEVKNTTIRINKFRINYSWFLIIITLLNLALGILNFYLMSKK